MSDLLELKERVRHFYGKYEVYLLPVVKFVLAFATFWLIGSNIGYMERINGLSVNLILALLCAILPVNAIILFVTVIVLANLYALSLEVCIVGVVLFAVIGLLYFRFSPKDGYFTVLTPICYTLHIPYAMPLAVGLLKNPVSAVSVVCGTVVYYFLAGVKDNAVLLSEVQEDTSAVSKFVVALNPLTGNREMYLVLAAFALMSLLVYFIRRMSVDHAWTIAIVTGILVEFIVLFAGFLTLGIEGKTVWLVAGNAICAALGFVLQFLFFNLDYTRTERVQFEDDEYYYYVKAVPKLYVPTKEKRVKSFGGKGRDGQRERERISREDLAEDLDIDRDLLDL